MKKRITGFTLIEVIIVIAIIGILAAVLIPVITGFVIDARITRFNSNARSVLSGAQLGLTDAHRMGIEIKPNTFYSGESGGCVAKVLSGGGNDVELEKYLGTEFKGYFGFFTNDDGYGADFAVWSEEKITREYAQLSLDDVQTNFENGGPYIGCSPLAS